jgi:transposase
MVFVGVDWAEDHHDVWVMDDAGEQLGYRRLGTGIEGVAGFHDLVAGHVEDPAEVVVAMETDRGLWVDTLVAAGYQIFGVNPKAVARYRERHRVSGGKSDRGDAKVLADLVRTDRHNHRRVAGDTAQVDGIQVLARAHQTLIWDRRRHGNRLRSGLREYYPAAVATFTDVADRDALAVLGKAPTPQAGARLSVSQIRAALKRGGRQRYLDTEAAEIRTGLRTGQLQAPEAVTAAYAATTAATVAILVELNRQIAELETTMTDRFEQHPDAAIYLSLPGLGVVLGARVLGEFGDDPNRFADVKSRRNYAATSPLTIATGKHRAVVARWVRNNRLYDPVMQWAFCSLTASEGCRVFYDHRRAKGDTYPQALRALGNRLVGVLHGCLDHRTLYDEHIAWGHRQPATETQAA